MNNITGGNNMNNEQLIKEFLEFQEVKRKTIIEEQQQTFTPPHDINSEIPANDYPKAKDVSDANNVLPLIKKVLEQQNIKGINKYGTTLVDDKELSTLDYLKHAFEETIDLAQYLAVAINELEGVADETTV